MQLGKLVAWENGQMSSLALIIKIIWLQNDTTDQPESVFHRAV